MIKTNSVLSIILVAAMAAFANPIPWPPPASMPLEDMHISISPSTNGLSAEFIGEFTFTHIPEDVNSMLFPVPPDANNIRVTADNIELPWSWSSEVYPTVLPEMPTIPMIEWQGPFPIEGALFGVDYEHDLIKRPDEFIFFYAVGTGKYYPTYDTTTTAFFDILLPPGFKAAGVWLDDMPHEYEMVESHLMITVQSNFEPITNDLIVSLVPGYFESFGTLVQGVECILFQPDTGGLYILDNLDNFRVGDRVRVCGVLNPNCISICMQGNGCIENNTISESDEDEPNSTGWTRLTHNNVDDTSPSWSPDGQTIAFVSETYGNSDIYLMNTDGSEKRNLTNKHVFCWSPSWSPDGTKIAFCSGYFGYAEIYIMNVTE